MTLEIIDLHVEVDGVEILFGVNITFEKGKIHALMGPNGGGKSTLANTIMGHPKYKITQGKIMLDGQDITQMKPNERAQAGLFLSFQHPAEIQGVKIGNLLRMAINNKRERLNEKKLSVVEFHKLMKEKMEYLKMDPSFNKRYINSGFSGGEKKRSEILQMIMLNPRYAMLDETDSGLDVDAIKLVAESINLSHKNNSTGIIVITHYHKFLEFLNPDKVSVICGGKITKQGGYELAEKIEQDGFEEVAYA
jgi:Fe-S cluster assembly ATP-binding protein